jgi:hypothetical protein
MQQADGSWGGGVECELEKGMGHASVEETALATEALLACGTAQHHQQAAAKGLTWLVDAVEANRHQETSPIGTSPASGIMRGYIPWSPALRRWARRRESSLPPACHARSYTPANLKTSVTSP